MLRNGVSDIDVAIIGAGAAGIAAGRRLAAMRPDLEVRLLEALPRIGGRALTVTAGSPAVPVDLGCGWLHGARDNAWTGIAGDLGFHLDDTLAPWDGAGRTLDLDSNDERNAFAALERFFEAAETRGSQDPDIAMGALLEPDGPWNGMIGAIGTYINGVELDRASLRDFDRYDPGRGPDRRVREGYGRVIEAYAVGLTVVPDTIVRAIDHSAAAIRLETNRGTLTARAVIVTMSTAMLAAEAIRFDPPLPDKAVAASALPLGIANKLFLAIPDKIELPMETHLQGSVRRVQSGTYHIGPFGRPLIECYFGGVLARDLERDRLAAVSFAIGELADHYGMDVARRLTPVAASAWAGQPHIGGSYSYAEPGRADERSRLAEPVDGRLFFAGEACSTHRFSTAHGAFETGVAAAVAIAKQLRVG